MKTLPEYITLLQSYMQQNASKYGILRMGIFGSVARNEIQMLVMLTFMWKGNFMDSLLWLV